MSLIYVQLPKGYKTKSKTREDFNPCWAYAYSNHLPSEIVGKKSKELESEEILKLGQIVTCSDPKALQAQFYEVIGYTRSSNNFTSYWLKTRIGYFSKKLEVRGFYVYPAFVKSRAELARIRNKFF